MQSVVPNLVPQMEGEGRREVTQSQWPHPAAFTGRHSVQRWICPSWGALSASLPTPTSHVPTGDSCRQRRSLFLPSSSVSPARIIILHLWHHHELQWGGWDVTNRGFCHKLRFLAAEWQERKETQKTAFGDKAFAYVSPRKRDSRQNGFPNTHTHTQTKQNKLMNHTTMTLWLLNSWSEEGCS